MSSSRFKPILMPGEAAAMLGVDPKTLAGWAKLGKIPSFKTIGGHRRYRREDIEAIINKREAGAP